MSKAQITLFIILGIVILIIFGFVFFITETTHEKTLESKIQQPISDFLKSKTINYYVTTCLDTKSKKALNLIGTQGGFIFEDQGGIIDWQIPTVEYTKKKVAYQIYSDLSGKFKDKNSLIYSPPYYPCFTRGPDSWIGENCHKTYDYNEDQYFFGTTSEPLHKLNPDLCKKKITMAGYVCTCSDSYSCKYSIQSQLESYVEREVKKCADFSTIKNYDIEAGDVKANVTFSDNNVLFEIEFPITIKIKDSQPIIEVLKFALPQKVRLKTIYNLAKELIKQDINDISFDIVEDGQEIANKYNNIEIKKDIPYEHTSIIKIEDSQSKIDGINYIFVFARENRNPALDYMRFTKFQNYDFYIIENQTLNFTPTAFDPDEDILIYDYTDWDPVADLLKRSIIYLQPKKKECIHPFSESSEKARCANYALRNTDIGPRKLKITTQDIAGLYDYQEINILVDDIPKINLVLNNTFKDIENNIASIEDPFVFDASKTQEKYPTTDALFSWNIIDKKKNIIFNSSWSNKQKIYFPSQYPNIEDIGGLFNDPGIHTLTLEVKNKQETPQENIALEQTQIQVFQCLPHNDPQNHPPFPFYNIEWDNKGPNNYVPETPFDADHTCCKDDGTYESSSKICYDLVDFGCFNNFKPGSKYYDEIGLTPQQIITAGSTGDQSKDVYKRTLIRRCSGNRGNTCTGQFDYKIEYIKTCTGTRHCTHSLNEYLACV